MSKLYMIRWKSKVNGRAGKGNKAFEQQEAERLVQELNQEYPEIEHELMEAGSPAPAGESPETSEPAAAPAPAAAGSFNVQD